MEQKITREELDRADRQKWSTQEEREQENRADDKLNERRDLVSLSLAKELKEAGYSQEGLFWWEMPKWDKTGRVAKVVPFEKVVPEDGNNFSPDYIVAPTVAELGERLPRGTFSSKNINGSWDCDFIYNNEDGQGDLVKAFQAKTEANARAKTWLRLKKEGLLNEKAEEGEDER